MHSNCNHLDSEGGGSMFLRDVIQLEDYMALQLQMSESEHLHLWKPLNLFIIQDLLYTL